MTNKSRKSSRRTEIKGDVHIKDGDLVAGDKTIIHKGEENDPSPEATLTSKRKTRSKRRDLQDSLEVSGGDVVFGDKIIKFFQDSLNIYLFKDVQQLLLFLLFVVVVAATLGGAYWYSRQPRVMTGDYNIAIAQFGEVQSNGTIQPSAKAEQISQLLFDYLDSEYQAAALGLNVEVSHRNMPLITENSQAQELAKKVGADIVIFGRVRVDNDDASFYPRFYVAEQPDTQELTGQNQLAQPILFPASELSAIGSVNIELRSRTEILFNFTRSLIYLSRKDMDSALRAIRTAIAAAENSNQPFAGQEVLYLVAAKVYLAQNDYEHASQMFDQAFQLNPEYARGHLGRGYMFYTMATSSPAYEPGLMEKAKAEFEQALQAPDQPEAAYIPVKAQTALGSALTIMAQANGDDPALFGEAIEHFTSVVNQYQQTKDPNLRPIAAISYFGMGAAYERLNNKAEAIQAYSQAQELTEDSAFKERIANQIKSLQ